MFVSQVFQRVFATLPNLKVRVCHSDHMFSVFSSASSVQNTGGLKGRIWSMNEQQRLLTHKPTQTRTHQQMSSMKEWERSSMLECFPAPLEGTAPPRSSSRPRSITPSPPMLSVSACVSSSCAEGRLELPESGTRITRSISETISFSYLFYMVSPSISLSSLLLSLTRALWLICVFTLCPSSPLLLLGI